MVRFSLPRGQGSGFFARSGDVGVYAECFNDACPDVIEGKRHAHLVKVERADGSIEEVDGDGKEADEAGTEEHHPGAA